MPPESRKRMGHFLSGSSSLMQRRSHVAKSGRLGSEGVDGMVVGVVLHGQEKMALSWSHIQAVLAAMVVSLGRICLLSETTIHRCITIRAPEYSATVANTIPQTGPRSRRLIGFLVGVGFFVL